jgi:hypothetical protein
LLFFSACATPPLPAAAAEPAAAAGPAAAAAAAACGRCAPKTRYSLLTGATDLAIRLWASGEMPEAPAASIVFPRHNYGIINDEL